jgi:serine/threonine protein kinase
MITTLKNRYKFSKSNNLIGKGGYGSVYEAYDEVLKRKVAIKITELSLNSKYSLSREAKILFQIDHPNVIKYYEVFTIEDNGNQYEVIVMEFASKGNLNDLSKYLPNIEQKELNKILKGILSGINYIHGLSIVHRDIKPANIFLSINSEGKIIPKIGDFFISLFYPIKLLSSTPSLFPNKQDNTQTIAGTPLYMAPEQFEDHKKIGPLSDFWGFGISLVELLKGHSPINPNGVDLLPAEISRHVKQFNVDEYLSKNKLPAPYDKVVRLCLQHDLGKRVSDVEILMHILEENKGNQISFSLSNKSEFSNRNTNIGLESKTQIKESSKINKTLSKVEKEYLNFEMTMIGHFEDFESESSRIKKEVTGENVKDEVIDDSFKLLKDELLNLFRKDRIEECFDSLVKVFKLNNTDLIMLENQWHNNQRKFRFGLITYEQENLTSNRIKMALINFIEELE